MYFVSFNMYCSKRSCRTEVLTSSATDTSLFVDNRNPERLRIIRILLDHTDGTCRTMSGAVSAAYLIDVHNAVVKTYDSVSDLD